MLRLAQTDIVLPAPVSAWPWFPGDAIDRAHAAQQMPTSPCIAPEEP
jgi:hypothetical protein